MENIKVSKATEMLGIKHMFWDWYSQELVKNNAKSKKIFKAYKKYFKYKTEFWKHVSEEYELDIDNNRYAYLAGAKLIRLEAREDNKPKSDV
jgi:transcriptional regulatory protein LevR